MRGVGDDGSQEDLMLGSDDGIADHSSKIPDSLQNLEGMDIAFPLDRFQPLGAMSVTANHVNHMYSCSKCFSTSEGDHPCSATHGYPMVFMGLMTVTEPSEQSNNALLFAQRLNEHISSQGLQGFVVQTDTLSLNRDSTGKKIIGILEESAVPHTSSSASSVFNMRDVFDTRKDDSLSRKINVKPLVIEVGYTGCEFEVPSEEGGVKTMRETWCMVMVTPARNLNVLDILQKSFFVASNPNSHGFSERRAFANENHDMFVQLLQYEASENCGFSRSDGNPADSLSDPSARMGLFSMTNMFMIPLKIIANTAKRIQGATKIRVIGFPELEWENTDKTHQYINYMNRYIGEVGELIYWC